MLFYKNLSHSPFIDKISALHATPQITPQITMKNPECDRCRYFDRSGYINCAPHPYGIESSACPDFAEIERRSSPLSFLQKGSFVREWTRLSGLCFIVWQFLHQRTGLSARLSAQLKQLKLPLLNWGLWLYRRGW